MQGPFPKCGVPLNLILGLLFWEWPAHLGLHSTQMNHVFNFWASMVFEWCVAINLLLILIMSFLTGIHLFEILNLQANFGGVNFPWTKCSQNDPMFEFLARWIVMMPPIMLLCMPTKNKAFCIRHFLYAKANFKFMIFLNQLPTLTKEYIVCNLDNELTWVIMKNSFKRFFTHLKVMFTLEKNSNIFGGHLISMNILCG